MIILILIILISFTLITELVSWGVFGRYIKEEDLTVYLTRHLQAYERNEISSSKLFYLSGKPFIATCFSLTSKWYINGYGRIPRWSKWSNKIDEHWEVVKNSNLLSDL